MNSLSPFKHRTFAFLWLAAVVSNIGHWMNEVGAGWLMLELSGNPLMVSLVAASSSLPVFLFVLIAGALADIFDRRKYLLFTQLFMLVFASGLTLLTWQGLMTPWLLLFFTFAIGSGAAFMMPAWDAMIPELVDREDLPQAVSLGSIGVNAARAVGPALAGVIISLSDVYVVFFVNTLSFFGVITALFLWKRQAPEKGMATERFVGSMKAGLRFVRHTKELQLVLIRAVLFFFPAIAILSLLPVYVSEILISDAKTLGFLQGSMGAGAIISAFLMPHFKRFLSKNTLLFLGSSILASAFLILALIPSVIFGCVALFIGGIAWITAFSLIRVTAQQAVPDWVRARAISVVLMVSFGSMTLGSSLWGTSASVMGIQSTLVALSICCVLFAFLACLFPLSSGTTTNFDQAEKFDFHDELLTKPNLDDGPVQVSIEYQVPLENTKAFSENMKKTKRSASAKWGLPLAFFFRP